MRVIGSVIECCLVFVHEQVGDRRLLFCIGQSVPIARRVHLVTCSFMVATASITIATDSRWCVQHRRGGIATPRLLLVAIQIIESHRPKWHNSRRLILGIDNTERHGILSWSQRSHHTSTLNRVHTIVFCNKCFTSETPPSMSPYVVEIRTLVTRIGGHNHVKRTAVENTNISVMDHRRIPKSGTHATQIVVLHVANVEGSCGSIGTHLLQDALRTLTLR